MTNKIPYGYCHCGCGRKTNIAKRDRFSGGIFYHKGEPFRFLPSHSGSSSKDLTTRFWQKVDKSGGTDACWIWTAARTKAGYGVLRMKNKTNAYAHRLAYEWCIGSIPENAVVCHQCDNPACVNPAHLFTGDQQTNMVDAAKKGRTAKGERLSPLTDEKVVAIRTEYAKGGILQRELAAKYGISRGGINSIILRKSWTHI